MSDEKAGASGRPLLPHHRRMLEIESRINAAVVVERGYFSVETKKELEDLGFGRSQQRPPALVVPIHGVVAGEAPWYLARPDEPRLREGRVVKYEIPARRRISLDVHPRAQPYLGDPSYPLLISEGPRKVDSLLSAGAKAVVGVVGVWSFRGSNPDGGKTVLPDWGWVALKDGREVFVIYDSDVMLKEPVQLALDAIYATLNRFGAATRFVYLPHGEGGRKTGADDFLAAGHTLGDILDLATTVKRRPPAPPSAEPDPDTVENAQPVALADAVEVFQRWLHLPDPEPVYVLLGAIAANRLPGDPVWLLIVGASGGGKTELVRACAALPESVQISTLTEAGLLSGTPRQDRAEHATGGVLRTIGALGIIVSKDFTSLLAMQKDARNSVLGALREVYDGKWSRPIGAEGGHVLHWDGKAGFIGGVTPEIDRQHAVMARMGERLLLARLPEGGAEEIDAVVDRALKNRSEVEQMRDELRRAAAGVIAGLPDVPDLPESDPDARSWTIELAKLTALGRAGAIYDRGQLIDVIRPEVPTRLAMQLEGLRVGMLTIGVEENAALRAMTNVALGCIPATRERILRFLDSMNGEATTTNAQTTLGIPNTSAFRELEALAAHRLVRRVGEQRQGVTATWELLPRPAATLSKAYELTSTSPDIGGSGVFGELPAASPTTPPGPISPDVDVGAGNGTPCPDETVDVDQLQAFLDEDADTERRRGRRR